jgi:hypothetical protein
MKKTFKKIRKNCKRKKTYKKRKYLRNRGGMFRTVTRSIEPHIEKKIKGVAEDITSEMIQRSEPYKKTINMGSETVQNLFNKGIQHLQQTQNENQNPNINENQNLYRAISIPQHLLSNTTSLARPLNIQTTNPVYSYAKEKLSSS